MELFGKGKKMAKLESENHTLRKRNRQLTGLCAEKDAWYKALMSDGLRHGSSFAGKQMAERKKYLQGK